MFESVDSDPWLQEAKLFTSLTKDQQLLQEAAESLAVQSFLSMSQVRFRVVERLNSEQMSPDGLLPLLCVGSDILVTGFPAIVELVEKRWSDRRLTAGLDASQKADHKILAEMVDNVFPPAVAYVSWVRDETYDRYTRPRFSVPFPWPLNHLLSYQRRRKERQALAAMQWADKSFDEVVDELDSCCQALSERLEAQDFLCADSATPVDARVFGFVSAILSADLPDPDFKEVVSKYQPLVQHRQRIQQLFFK